MRKIPRDISERLIAAADPISQRGLNGTKIEDIVTATGIAKATLYYYFEGKESIFAFLLEDVLRELADEVRTAADGPGTGAERLSDVIAAQLRVMNRRPAVCRALLGELSRAGRMPDISEMLTKAYARPLELVLIAGVDDGSIAAQDDPAETSVALIGAITAIAIPPLLAGRHVDEVKALACFGNLLGNGLRPREID